MEALNLKERLRLSYKKNTEKINLFKENYKKLKIGIMGGTFNPIHNAHLATAEFIRDKYGLDKVVFVPIGTPPHKKHILDKNHRYNMVVLSTYKNDDFFVSDYEISSDDKMSYTVDTLRHFNEEFKCKELYFITGSDAINEIESWKNFKENFKRAYFIAAIRPGINLLETQENIARFRKKYGANIDMLYVPSLEISSTYIRSRIKSNKSIKYLVPSRVEEYIYDNSLYGGVKKVDE